MKIKHKVFAYITQGERILVFDHVDFPEAGTQVPAGTLGENEDPMEGVIREAREETGINDFSAPAFLGQVDFDIVERNETHRRRFYHIASGESEKLEWVHYETDPSDGSKAPIRFKLYWLDLRRSLPELAPGHNAFVDSLRKKLRIELNEAVE